METTRDQLVQRCLERLDGHIVLALPLGLGKPNRLVNALYDRAVRDSDVRLDILTALSLNPPTPSHPVEARFLGPFLERHFGRDYPRLDYADDLAREQLPPNVRVFEFYFQSGAMLGKSSAQRHYISSNYTHVARDLADRGVNLAMQLIAKRETPEGVVYSLSCNPDVTLDLLEELQYRPDQDCMLIGQVHPDLPFMEGDAVVAADTFDEVLDTDPEQPLFAIPRNPISTQDYAVGLNASALIKDEGTLQIGIGSLSDALVHGLILRQKENDRYREWFGPDLAGAEPINELGGKSPMQEGLYGASEMFLDGFMHLYRAGILARKVFDDEDLQRLANDKRLDEAPEAQDNGVVFDGGFFLGSREFYDWLRGLDERERPLFRMHSVGRINQLYGGNEVLETLQRQHSRFVNTCMMVDLTGAAVSDGLADHQVVSGVGGQYNFVAMAHAMRDGRSILMLRSTRKQDGELKSNIVWEYPHTTIPRHLRDIVVSEYGIADLRGRTDEECIQALLQITDARFQEELRARAVKAGKLDAQWQIPETARGNLPEKLEERLTAIGGAHSFPSFPFGSDFTATEERLIPALKYLKNLRRNRLRLLGALLRGGRGEPEALEHMGLAAPTGLRERLLARLLRASLDRTVGHRP